MDHLPQLPLDPAMPHETFVEVHVEHRREAHGIGTTRPRLSWSVATLVADWHQGSYEIEAYGPDGTLLNSTGRVEANRSVLVEWPFTALESRERRSVRVRVWNQDGQPTSWSQPVEIETGLLHPNDWIARFITPAWDEDTSRPQPSPLLRHEFDLRGTVTSARLYITALGVYEAHLNGNVIGDHVLDPGWTSYRHRLRYQIFDVSGMLQAGRNAIGATLGDGWFRGRLGFGGGQRNIYGDRLALLAQLEIIYADGTIDRIVSDESWRAATGPILASDLYDGETYDARLERPGWATPGYDTSDWQAVRLINRDLATLVAPIGPPVRRTEILAPVAITTSPSGRTLVDFGQNLVGRLRLTVQGPMGQTITLRHAEVLEHGELGTRPLRFAAATDHYTLRGGEPETWEPAFTFHGFRYAEVQGWPGELRPANLQAVICHSDLERTGWFECSDPLLNRLHENVVWSMRGNFLDIPTDCPQRDERLGWTGDIQVFTPTAGFLYHTAGFLQSWLADLAAEQREFGVVPIIVPNVLSWPPSPAAAWGDAATVVPWVLYQRYGDTGILEQQFDSMRAWVDLLHEKAGPGLLWDRGFQFGDWLDPAAPPDNPGAARTSPAIVATAYFAHSAELTGQAARVLGRTAEAEQYLDLAARIRAAFRNEYVTPNGRMVSDAVTAYALAIEFKLVEDAEQRQRAGQRLVALVRENAYRISTGFVGTPLICDALCHVGAYEAAFRLLMERECPSWLYPVTMGATTIWERWDSMLPDGSINPGEMTSFNHYPLGAVADWLHRTVAGLAPAAPGYRRIEIKPQIGGGLTYAHARHHTPYGMAEVGWSIEGDEIIVVAMIPPDVTAEVSLPGTGQAPFEVGPGMHRWTYPYQQDQRLRPILSLDNPFGEIIDHAEAYAMLLSLLRKHLPEAAVSTAMNPQGRTDMPLRLVLSIQPHTAALIPDVERALAELG